MDWFGDAGRFLAPDDVSMADQVLGLAHIQVERHDAAYVGEETMPHRPPLVAGFPKLLQASFGREYRPRAVWKMNSCPARVSKKTMRFLSNCLRLPEPRGRTLTQVLVPALQEDGDEAAPDYIYGSLGIWGTGPSLGCGLDGLFGGKSDGKGHDSAAWNWKPEGWRAQGNQNEKKKCRIH